MDSRLPGGSGVEAIKLIRTEFPAARIIVLTTYDFDDAVSSALAVRAAGYILKSVECAELSKAIREVHAGGHCFPQGLAIRLSLGANAKLSPREQQALELLSRGLSNREVGLAMSVSENTAKAYLKNIFAKLGAADRTEAVSLGYQLGLLQADIR